MQKSSSAIPIIISILLVACCCLILLLSGVMYALYEFGKMLPTSVGDTPWLTGPTPTRFEINRPPVDGFPTETLLLLKQTIIPENDLAEIACRLQAICDVPITMEHPTEPYQIGDRKTFWVGNSDTHDHFQVEAVLHYITPHSYFWAQDGVRVDKQEVRDLMETFENEIYPTNRNFFGSEWTPGVDGDPHVYVLYTSGLGNFVAGYVSSADSYHPLIRPYSNAHEMFYISSSQPLGDEYTYSTLAHEFQHMIHWHNDPNEGSFLNEGFSELASFLNGYDTGGFDWYYVSSPDINLTDWQQGGGQNTAHYGANFLFVTYFLDRFGDQATRALVSDRLNGLESVDNVLALSETTDPLTGQVVSADDFFLDWTIANFIQDASVEDGRYTYHNYPDAPRASDTEALATCPLNTVSRTVNQYGVDYIRITCPGTYSLHFEGATVTPLLPVDPHSGSYAFWSNKGDSSNMTLTRDFDFTEVSAPISMSYWIWYDIEQSYDYLYFEASTDGRTWEILVTPSGTGENPTKSSFGWGYNGESGGWIQESLDLSRFAGQRVSLRFDYITDMAVVGEGLLLDDVSIPAIDYFTDFERDDGGWQADGFVRIANALPQTFRLALITRTAAGRTEVESIPVSDDQSAIISLKIGEDGARDVVLVVTATTRFTRLPAGYQISIR